ncbi:EAL domain-containing protein [Vibrio alginolyticus]|uniref:EAL domain-containing protein n=1 Tax=Vibrio alginolyticus TaxID=663 RepID=UPI002FEEBC4E
MLKNWKLFIFFIITLVVCSMSFRVVNSYLTTKALSRDAELLLFDFHESLLDAHGILDKYSDTELDICTPQVLAALSLDVYHHAAIRMIGLAENGAIQCATDGPSLHLSQYSVHNISHSIKLVAAKDSNDDHHELLLVKQHGNEQLFVSLTPFLIAHLEESRCSNCLAYRLAIEGDPRLLFESRPIDSVYITSKASRHEGTLNVTLQLEANKKFYDSYVQISIFSAVTASLLLSIMLTTVLYRITSIRQSLEHILQQAINHSEFIPYYQPIVDSRTNSVVGAEVLVRWRKANGSIIPPYQFIPYAEDSGLIIPITTQLLDKVMQDIVQLGWEKGEQFVSINIVPMHLENDKLYHQVVNLCSSYKVNARAISLEITERLEISDLEQAKAVLKKFYQNGINLKLDDAGTGYGGFSYVQELRIDTLKIDKMFVDTIETTDVKNSVLDAIISFVKTSNLEAIAEGVETKEQVEYLNKRGIYKIQGYIYAKPMPLEEFQQWLLTQL